MRPERRTWSTTERPFCAQPRPGLWKTPHCPVDSSPPSVDQRRPNVDRAAPSVEPARNYILRCEWAGHHYILWFRA